MNEDNDNNAHEVAKTVDKAVKTYLKHFNTANHSETGLMDLKEMEILDVRVQSRSPYIIAAVVCVCVCVCVCMYVCMNSSKNSRGKPSHPQRLDTNDVVIFCAQNALNSALQDMEDTFHS